MLSCSNFKLLKVSTQRSCSFYNFCAICFQFQEAILHELKDHLSDFDSTDIRDFSHDYVKETNSKVQEDKGLYSGEF